MTIRVIPSLWLITILAGASAWADRSTEPNILEDQRVAEARALMQAGRDEIIDEEMRLSDTERERFWPVYQDYRAEVILVQDRYASMIGRYLETYEAGEISDEYAEDLLDDWLGYKADLLKVRKQYVRQFRKILPNRQVFRLFQLENKMDAEIEVELARSVPLMEPF